MSSPNARVQQDSRTGEYFTVDRNDNRRRADVPSRPRTINPAPHTPTSRLHSTPGIAPSTTQQRGPFGVSLPSQPRTVDRGSPTGNLANLSSSNGPTARRDSTLASPVPQCSGGQWTPNAPQGVRSVQAGSPEYLPAVPTSSTRFTDAAPPSYANTAGTIQGRSGVSPSTGRTSIQTTQGSAGYNGGQATHGDAGGQLPRLQDLDDSYKLRNKSFFVQGRVLMALWTEPMGTSASGRSPSSGGKSYNRDVYMVAYGEMAFSKVRRFVIVGASERSCTVLAISTHCGTGAKYMQQDQSQYGLVYTCSTPPGISESERGMQSTAVRIDPDNLTMPLNSMSRIHYGNIYTIQHNIRVKAYGMVNQASVEPLMSQFRQVNGHKFGFYTGPPQTLQEGRPSPEATAVPSVPTQRPSDPRQLLEPRYQRAMERHPPTVAGPSATTQLSRNNVQNAARQPQPNAPGRAMGPATKTRRPAPPPPSVETLRQRGFDEAQIRSIHEMMRRGATAPYAMAKITALAQLDCTQEAANRIAHAVQNGMPYEAVVAQYRAATEQ